MLHLDGVIQSTRTIQAHFWENRETDHNSQFDLENTTKYSSFCSPIPTNFFNSEILGRLSGLQILCILVDTVVTETLRGAVQVIGGILTLNKRAIGNGVNDLASVMIQAIILPVLAVISTIAPKKAEKLGLYLVKHAHKEANVKTTNEVHKIVMSILLGGLLIPLSAVRSAIRAPILLLNGDISEVLYAIFCVVKEPFACIGKLVQLDYQGIYAEYGPTAFSNIVKKAFWYVKVLQE